MSDIFREVEEDVRRERIEQFWKKYNDYIVAGVALIVVAVAGGQLYRVYEQREAIKASATYESAQQALESNQPRAAAELFGALVKTAPSGYATLARLAGADALNESGNHAEAIQIEKQLAAGNDASLGAPARIHAAWSIVDTAPKAEVETLLGPLTDPANAWHLMAREILAYADLRAGESEEALREFQALAADPNAPSSLRGRTNAMTTFLKAGGDANFGKVPQPPPAPAQLAIPTPAGGPPSK
ncbi:MAG TPA: tetratricopeptide repeat protein [Rhizomicrobium sp.]